MDEIQLLREALDQCLKVMPELDSHAEETWLSSLANESEAGQKQARFALQVTSGKLPDGYEVEDDQHGNFYPRHNDHDLLEKDRDISISFASEFEARLFCWQHFQEDQHTTRYAISKWTRRG